MTIFDMIPRPIVDALAFVGVVAIVGAGFAWHAWRQIEREWRAA